MASGKRHNGADLFRRRRNKVVTAISAIILETARPAVSGILSAVFRFHCRRLPVVRFFDLEKGKAKMIDGGVIGANITNRGLSLPDKPRTTPEIPHFPTC